MSLDPMFQQLLESFCPPAQQVKLTHEDRLRNIVRTYRKAKEDPRMVLPTPLMLLLEAASIAVANEEALAKANAYANDAIKRDKINAHSGADGRDQLTVDGRTFAPGR